MSRPFRDRREAGRVLAGQLAGYAGRPGLIVLALPRGGVPVAYEVAVSLGAPLDVFLVRKLGVPGHEGLGLGAVASGGVRCLNRPVVDALKIAPEVIERETEAGRVELARLERAYRGDAPPVGVRGRPVILVDDGLATSATMRAAVLALRAAGPSALVVAVPTSAALTCDELRAEADRVVCAWTPEPSYAGGLWYDDFSQTGDDEVRDLLGRAWARAPG